MIVLIFKHNVCIIFSLSRVGKINNNNLFYRKKEDSLRRQITDKLINLILFFYFS